MQVSLENTGALERKLTVRVPSDRVETRIQERMREMGRTVRMKGFRPGKIPPRLIEQRFGSQVRSEVMGDVIGKSFQQAVTEQKLRPAMAPRIATSSPKDGEIEYTATFEVMPELDTIDVGSLSIQRPVAEVGEADVDNMIETLRLQRREWSTVERPAATGDLVMFEYHVDQPGARFPAEGEERAGTVIGSGAMFAEVEARLIGTQEGARESVGIVLPEGFRDEGMAGKPANVEVHVLRVQQARLPEVDDSFVASFGVNAGGMQQFRKDVRANLERELGNVLRGKLKSQTIEKLLAAHSDIDVPMSMVASEARALQASQRQQAEQAKAAPDQIPSIEQLTPAATQRVRAFVLLSELARQNRIELDTQRVQDMLVSIASTYEDPQEVVELYARDPEMLGGLRNRVLEDQVIDWVADHASTIEQPLSFDELMRPQATRA